MVKYDYATLSYYIGNDKCCKTFSKVYKAEIVVSKHKCVMKIIGALIHIENIFNFHNGFIITISNNNHTRHNIASILY